MLRELLTSPAELDHTTRANSVVEMARNECIALNMSLLNRNFASTDLPLHCQFVSTKHPNSSLEKVDLLSPAQVLLVELVVDLADQFFSFSDRL